MGVIFQFDFFHRSSTWFDKSGLYKYVLNNIDPGLKMIIFISMTNIIVLI